MILDISSLGQGFPKNLVRARNVREVETYDEWNFQAKYKNYWEDQEMVYVLHIYRV